jgi:hypothetical protein
MDKIKLLLGSRKFWAAFVGLVLVVIKAYRPDFPLNEEQFTGVIAVLVAYILGTAVEDAGAAKARADSSAALGAQTQVTVPSVLAVKNYNGQSQTEPETNQEQAPPTGFIS